ncbi:MAG: nitroreductase family protein [Candidatus Omnitrophica bacterium]|nr:nitroreductase family protein [Candidatus Omnitrophota bacterium]MBU1524298.1 nitroreductase family protein [Candidatus Omnitrophota bacterium]
METFEAIAKRVSVREYQSRPIEKALLEKLVDTGRRAPTARRVEPWEFVVIHDKEVLNKLGEIASTGRFIKDAAACIVIFCQDTKYYLEDGCAATENILLAAASFGLGACWVAGDKKPYVGELSRFLNAPLDLKLVSLISLGWPKQEIKQVRARSLLEVLHWEKF